MTMAAPGNPPSSAPLPLVDLVPLMLEEWPDLNQQDLVNIADDPEATVLYIATHTDHTRTLVRRHLEELASLLPADGEPNHFPADSGQHSDSDPADGPADTLTPTPDQTAEPLPANASDAPSSTLDHLLGELEDRTDQLIQDFKADMLPELEKKARSNLGTSLLMALGLGVILGLLLGGKRG